MPITSVYFNNQNAFLRPIDTPIYSCNVQNLYTNPNLCLAGNASPCFQTILFASILRTGRRLTNEFGEELVSNLKEIESTIFKADLEIEFEIIRRANFPNKPSRLSSIFAVEDNLDGKICLRKMFSTGVKNLRYSPLVLNVKVGVCYLYHKGDIQWLDEYAETKNVECIQQYWRGNACTSIPLYEYFLEGALYPSNKLQLMEIRESGPFFENYDSSQFWLNLDDQQFASWFDDQLGGVTLQ